MTAPLVTGEPPRGQLWPADVLDRSGLELMRAAVAHEFPDPPLARMTGLRLTEAGLGTASAAMPASPWWQSGAGVFLAGTAAFIADLPLAAAVFTSAPAGSVVSTSELSVSFVRPATIRSGSLIGRARLIHSTRSLGLAEASVEDAQGRLLAHSTSRCVIVPMDRGALRPAIATTADDGTPDPYLRPVEGDVRDQDFWNATAGIDVMREVIAGAFHPPVFLFFGMRAPEGAEGSLTVTMPRSLWLCNAFGVLYGGAISMLADTAMTLATATTVPAATAFSPLDLTIHFLRPVLGGEGALSARARVTHRGRTIAVVTCEIVDERARLVAIASSSVLILPGRPWERPVHVADEFTQDTAS